MTETTADTPSQTSKPKRLRVRTSYNLDAQSLAILDGEITKEATLGEGIKLSRPMMLNRLLQRAVVCRCYATSPPPPSVAPEAKGCSLDVEAYSSALLRQQAEKLSRSCVTVNRHQVLRLYLLRAWRCSCPPIRLGATDETDPRLR